jgi:2-polyprenyl-3-methyl-5-hydroxy-6-metoxy-1,4-benzoquinol methylase/rhodanese-related sulfurtransferase
MQKGYKQLIAEANTAIETVPVAEAVQQLDNEEVVFVDIRDLPEVERDGKVPGAVHASRGMLEFHVDPESPYHKDVFASGKKLLLYSTNGSRSALAAQRLQEMGLTHIAHVGGGLKAWKEADGPVEAINGNSVAKRNSVADSTGVAQHNGKPANINTAAMDALKAKLKGTWMSGDYAKFAPYLLDGALEFLTAVNIPTEAKVLDVACGAGQTALPLARRGIEVTGIDIAANLIAVARERAQAEGLRIQFDEGDAELLPYEDASFDVVFSLIGAMFAPQPQKVAAELARVCRPGGRIIMGNWTPTGFVGQMFKTIGAHVPPPPGVPGAPLWGDEATVRERLGGYVSDLRMTRRLYPFNYPFAVAGVVEFFREYYGPMNRAFAALDVDGQAALRHDLEQLWSRHNQATDGTVSLGAEYLEVQAVRRF